MSEGIEENALLNWLRTFALEKNVENLSELSDGVVLSRIFSEICDDDQVKELVTEAEESWAFRASRLRRLMARIKSWYIEILGLEIQIEHWDAEAAARDDDVVSIVNILELILGAAVRCAKREIYVKTIMETLSEDNQAMLMIVVDRTLKRAVDVVDETKDKRIHDDDMKHLGQRRVADQVPIPPSKINLEEEEEVIMLRRALTKAQREIAQLRDELTIATQNKDPFAETTSLREELDVVGGREAEARSRLDLALGKMREIEFELESIRKERDQWQEKHDALFEKSTRLESRLAVLEDEADLGRAARENLDKAEEQIIKLKKKLEEAQTLKRDNKSLDEQNAKYLAEIVQLEAKAQTSVEDRRQLELIKIERDQALTANLNLQEDLDQAQTNLHQYQQDLDHALEAKRFLEEELSKLNSTTSFSNNHTMNTALNTNNDDDIFAVDSTELRTRLAQLERENARLTAKTNEIDRLQTVADDATKKLRESIQHNEELRKQNRRLRDEFQTTSSEQKSNNNQEAPPPLAFFENEEQIINKDDNPPFETIHDIARLQKLLREKEAARASAVAEVENVQTATRKSINNTEGKYAAMIRSLKETNKRKDEKIALLESKNRTERAQYKREEALIVSAIYDLGQRLIEANLADTYEHVAGGRGGSFA
mmetsp:Transcript_11427/g.17049  ORF Transcript_11427/g.17049 Transcript_11427/m.17049 type:complete len:658 (+) Transcript_11427:59-2032(+)